MTEIQNNAPTWVELRLQAVLVNDYRQQLGLIATEDTEPVELEPITPDEAQAPYENCVIKLATLLGTPEGRQALGVPQAGDAPSEKEPNSIILRRSAMLASFFAPDKDNASVDIPKLSSAATRVFLRQTFRRLAVIERENPELIQPTVVDAAIVQLHMAQTVSRTLQQKFEILNPKEYQVITALHGLFGLRKHSYRELAARHRMSSGQIAQIAVGALAKLRAYESTTQTDDTEIAI